ncbi:hypothetical protein QVD17_18479 [Tagetes erecta]|uniref:Uncharacterized protein n=1 Tax=Tagetes erecta TaxID=13708 RepID=A0AAD8NWF2_TARER|nr:hypothetical protein QVD17_18479 [Tagetes erecta]
MYVLRFFSVVVLVFSNATGRSGGIATFWNPTLFSKSDVLKDQNFLLISGNLIGLGIQLHIVNVYAPQGAREKRSLWERITSKMATLSGRVIILGDFNVVRSQEERLNSTFNAGASASFNEFINGLNLLEYHMCRKKFTFIPSNLLHMSKLDRALVNIDFMNAWPNAIFSALDRGLSDHCPILLQCSCVDFGPSPFRFFNSWLKREQFPAVVHQAATIPIDPSLPPDKKLASKLKNMKSAIKNWVAVDRAKNDESLLQWEKELFLIEQRAELGLLNDVDVSNHIEILKNLTLIHESKNLDMKQKARVKWSIDGDENSAYFHGLFKAHSSVNLFKSHIYGIGVDRNEVDLVANSIGINKGDLPIHYLGLPVGANMRSGIGGTWRAIVKVKQSLAAYGFDLPNACNGDFNSKEIKLLIDKTQGSDDQEPVFKWNNWVPKKVNVMNWRASLNRLPTLISLQARGVNVQTSTCLLCNEADETAEHVFTACPKVTTVWNSVASWCKISPLYAFSINDIFELHVHKPGSPIWKKLINAIVLVTCWCFWKARNEQSHGNKVKTADQIVNEVKAMSFLWIRNRATKICADWNQWSSFAITL